MPLPGMAQLAAAELRKPRARSGSSNGRARKRCLQGAPRRTLAAGSSGALSAPGKLRKSRGPGAGGLLSPAAGCRLIPEAPQLGGCCPFSHSEVSRCGWRGRRQPRARSLERRPSAFVARCQRARGFRSTLTTFPTLWAWRPTFLRTRVQEAACARGTRAPMTRRSLQERNRAAYARDPGFKPHRPGSSGKVEVLEHVYINPRSGFRIYRAQLCMASRGSHTA